MVCKECYFKSFCYAENPERVECDTFASELKAEYKFYTDRIKYLNDLKTSADRIQLQRILAEIDQLEDFAEYTCQDMAIGPREETDELPF